MTDLLRELAGTFDGVEIQISPTGKPMKFALFLCLLLPATVHAQTTAAELEQKYPALLRYLNTAEVLQAAVYEEVIAVHESTDSIESMIGRRLMLEQLAQFQKAQESHYHTSSNHLAMPTPYRVFETRATPSLLAVIRRQHDQSEVAARLAGDSSIPNRALAILSRGRELVLTLLSIYLAEEITDKDAAVDMALAEYLMTDSLSVAAQPKSSNLLSKHQYAYAFRVGFPQLSGLTWASQWLQLATLEILLADDTINREAGVTNVIAMFKDKLVPVHGSMMLQLPTDIPTSPVIAPNLYNRHRAVSYVIDNLAMFRVVLGDILAHPEVEDPDAALVAVMEDFTSKTEHLEDEMAYLEFVLRGGIFNQGGPARGGMDISERNRSREATGATHSGPTYTMF